MDWMYHRLFSIPLSMVTWVVSVSATVDYAAINTGLQLSFLYADFTFFGYIPGHGIAGSYGRFVFSYIL